jgi:hypothetical protein
MTERATRSRISSAVLVHTKGLAWPGTLLSIIRQSGILRMQFEE